MCIYTCLQLCRMPRLCAYAAVVYVCVKVLVDCEFVYNVNQQLSVLIAATKLCNFAAKI